eukprot:TRINITY_DN16658_c0_g1_i1.p3 TRINITY_DN16658_c0_g1~~TRINITY_DN16658_c0_g1_i1.p3  ORF type:complete len:144 (+),score=32.64 TRINITY_DN16658_c0_g1_i1:64-495(+)
MCIRDRSTWGIYRGEEHTNYNNARPYVFIKPPEDTKLDEQDQVFVFCLRQPRDEEGRGYGHEDHPFQANTEGVQIEIKTRLLGKEGENDVEIAKELNKVGNEFKEIGNELKSLNQSLFSQGLIQPGFITRVGTILREELSSIS